MRKRLIVLGVVTSLIGSGVVIGAMIPASSQEGGNITVCDQNRPGYNKDIDVGRNGFSPGDYSVFQDKLLNTQTGNGAGRLVGRLTFVKVFRKANDVLFIADITTQLRRGKISFYGAGRFGKFRTGLKLPVTGGTGAYSGAGGSVTGRNGKCDGKPGIRLTFNLT
jgi:hypothetical protein